MPLFSNSFKSSLCALSAFVLGAGSVLAQAPAAAPEAPAVVPATPAAKKEPPKPYVADKKSGDRFMELHNQYLARGKSGPIDLLFLGDSITEGWKKAPDVLQEHYGKYNVANFGIGGDRTEHVLWRIENGELDGIKPKVVVLMIGTNNSGSCEAPDITKGVQTIVEKIQQKLPDTKILLLAIFPRGPRMKEGKFIDNTLMMQRITAINAELAKMENGKSIRFLDIGPKFLGPDGKIPDAIMPDQLHPDKDGYVIWANAMDPLLTEMMAGSKTP